MTKTKYKIYGYQGKQVRDNMHAFDLVNAFYHYFQDPRCGEAYNIGGGRFSNVSILEAIAICEDLTGEKFIYEYVETKRIGDHLWWISDLSRFRSHYPQWEYKFSLLDTCRQIYQGFKERL